MKYISIVVALLFSTSAFAGVTFGGAGGEGGAGGTAVAIAIGAAKSVSNSSANANANSKSFSSSNAQQQQGQIQGQQQGQILRNQNRSSANNNGGNVAITEMHRKNLRNAPSFGLPAAFPTAVCQGTAAAGFSFWLGGGAVAGTITIEECMKMETIRLGVLSLQNSVTAENAIAQQKANDEVWCMTKYGGQTTMCTKAEPEVTASGETVPAAEVVATFEPKKVASIPDVTHEPKRAKIWFFWFVR